MSDTVQIDPSTHNRAKHTAAPMRLPVTIVAVALAPLLSVLALPRSTSQGNGLAERVLDLERLFFVHECRFLRDQPFAAKLVSGEGKRIALPLRELFSRTRTVKNRPIEAILVPSGNDWAVLRAYSIRPTGFEKLDWKCAAPLLRRGEIGDSNSECQFSAVPPGEYEVIFTYRAATASGSKRGIETRASASIRVDEDAETPEVTSPLKPLPTHTYYLIPFKDLG